jgi:lipase
MILHTQQWGPERSQSVVCIHGLTHNSGVFRELGESLAEDGHATLSLDLRGHGRSGWDPPWNLESHVRDVMETIESKGISDVLWVGHSFGGRVAARLAELGHASTAGLALLESPPRVDPGRALRAIEIERLDWSFATIDGAIAAAMASDLMAAPPAPIIERFVRENVSEGQDGRLRFRYSPGAVVVAWNEMTLPQPSVSDVPTLVITAEKPLATADQSNARYASLLGEKLVELKVPNGHNVLWESPRETISALRKFAREVMVPA